jgi:chondroitin AC lyase
MRGGRHFWRSDYTAYHAPSHFTSLKMFSTRMTNNEICNDENLKADHTADGALYTYQTGQEYLGIFPVWDCACQRAAAIEIAAPLRNPRLLRTPCGRGPTSG